MIEKKPEVEDGISIVAIASRVHLSTKFAFCIVTINN